MEEKYNKAIIAGLLCGIILVILSFLSVVGIRLAFGTEVLDWLNQISQPYYVQSQPDLEIPAALWIAGAAELMLMALGVLTFFFSGVLAVRMASTFVKTKNDAIILGVLSGAVAEVVHRPFAMIFSMIMDLIKPMNIYYSDSSTIMSAITTAGSQLVCCFPFVLVTGIILAVLGALAYAVIALKV